MDGEAPEVLKNIQEMRNNIQDLQQRLLDSGAIEKGSELEQPLAVARDIQKLHEALSVSKNSSTIDKFLSQNNHLRHVVRRAFIVEKFPYSEIQDNTIGKDLMPIDMLRLKLSFFGALKFDPRSDKWLRICMFQGAPLPNELKSYDEQWVYKTKI